MEVVAEFTCGIRAGWEEGVDISRVGSIAKTLETGVDPEFEFFGSHGESWGSLRGRSCAIPSCPLRISYALSISLYSQERNIRISTCSAVKKGADALVQTINEHPRQISFIENVTAPKCFVAESIRELRFRFRLGSVSFDLPF